MARCRYMLHSFHLWHWLNFSKIQLLCSGCHKMKANIIWSRFLNNIQGTMTGKYSNTFNENIHGRFHWRYRDKYQSIIVSMVVLFECAMIVSILFCSYDVYILLGCRCFRTWWVDNCVKSLHVTCQYVDNVFAFK